MLHKPHSIFFQEKPATAVLHFVIHVKKAFGGGSGNSSKKWDKTRDTFTFFIQKSQKTQLSSGTQQICSSDTLKNIHTTFSLFPNNTCI